MDTAEYPSGARKWIIALTVVFGSFMAVMDISVVNVALPHMMGSFGANLSEITWVATAYSIAEIIMLTMAAWWSTLLGRKRLYVGSFILFTAGSALCGTATSFTQMIVYRIIQGIGGGTLIPVSQAILRESFPPEEQGMAMAVNGMGIVLAPAIGPVLGGWLTDHFGWPWIFYINVPISIVGILMVMAFVFDPAYLRRGVKSIDWGGIALLTIGLTLMQLVLERGEQEDWFQSSWIIAGTIATVASIVGLVVWELLIKEPIIDFRLLKNIPLTVGSLIGLVFGIGLFGTTFLLPEFTQHMLGYTAYDAGLVLLPRAIALFVFMPVAGALYKHVDARVLIIAGIALIIWSSYGLSELSLSHGFWDLVPILIIMGAGMPFMFVTMTTVALSTVPREDMTQASGIYTLTRRVGGNIAYALVATIVAHRSQFHRSHLVENVNAMNPNYQQFHGATTAALVDHGMTAQAAPQAVLGIANNMVNQQATMLSYNDVAWIMAGLFLLALPLVFLLPKPKKKKPGPAPGH
ncbi:MAG: DHA2 family efflux MFS transporter permease subunit [Planctomycetes bacterium]|nr:DHA2 family efflux MFS transporter permease subunit [Planctomycetota bacterium]